MLVFKVCLLFFLIGAISAEKVSTPETPTSKSADVIVLTSTEASTSEATSTKDMAKDTASTIKPKAERGTVKNSKVEELHKPIKSEPEVIKFMKFFHVIPDVIDEGPQHFLKVNYVTGVFADRGIELSPNQVQNQPLVIWEADPDAYYTLLLVDPDAPSRVDHSQREWQHWLVVNIPDSEVEKGEVLSEYIGPAPPEGTGLHRYVFLLFKQPAKLSYDEKHLTNDKYDGRSLFSTRKFVKKYKLGVPVAGNFFQAQKESKKPKI